MKFQTLSNAPFLLFFLVVLGIASCKKGQKEPIIEKTVSLDKSAVFPGDLVTVSTSFSLPSASSMLTIGNKQVTLVATEDKKAVFTVPVLTSGNYTINFSALDVNTSPNLTVNAYEPITNPQAVFDQFKDKTEVAMTEMVVLKNDPIAPLSAEDYAFMVDLNTQLNAIYSTLNTEEKLLAAYSMQKLSFEQIDLASLDNSSDLYALSSTAASFQPRQAIAQVANARIVSSQSVNATADAAADADPGESLVRTGKKFVTSMSFTVSAIGIGILALEAPEPTGLTKFIAIAAGITAGYQLSQALTLVGRICSQFGVPSTINDPVFRPATTMSLNSKSTQSFAASSAAAGLTLYNNAPVNLEVTSKFRTLTTADAGSSNDLIKSIFQSEQQLATMYNKLQSAFNKVKSWFSGKSPALPGYVSKMKATSSEKDFYLPASTLSISNVSDAAVSVTATPKDGQLVVTASSSIGTAEKPLTFDLTYKNATLGTSVKKTINTTYDPRVGIVGIWYLKKALYVKNAGSGDLRIERGDNLVPVKSWNFSSNGKVSLFDGNRFMDDWVITLPQDDWNNGASLLRDGLMRFHGTLSYVLSADKKYVTIPWSSDPTIPGFPELPSQNQMEILTLTSTKLELRVPYYNSSTYNNHTQWSELITLTFSREP
jgi:hypothetical protein